MLRKYYKRNEKEKCLNWWPLPVDVKVDEKIVNPICRACANWLPDTCGATSQQAPCTTLGDIEDILKGELIKKDTICINEWPPKVLLNNGIKQFRKNKYDQEYTSDDYYLEEKYKMFTNNFIKYLLKKII